MATGRRRNDDLHTQVLETLMDKVRTDPFPSTTHLDMVEQMLRDEDKDDYAQALLEKVQGDAFPSLDHLRRLQGLT